MGQAYSGDLQIIVADDASPVPFCYDGESSLVQVVTRPSNGGFGSAVNSGAAVANLELLLILNSDVEFAAGFLADFVTQSSPWMPAVASPGGGSWRRVSMGWPTLPDHCAPKRRVAHSTGQAAIDQSYAQSRRPRHRH
ncbi:glycosyltransferase family 2 protein [Ornithinimicrobium sp. INDO-MA30-4]|uniref:glycosyltransferase family 2 protein n=1 Tax=Ornithinimicrobium sp. INDO-MA30-4 TaxID=2908651 RepID=UPI001F276689|nr:glycosyltransferase [Ornithinimicrobium sp. INDO-MA30-4]UJH69898.1 glycosyltransferase [Ornithinimicrobium sp. INDO-MA30-4]